MEIPMRQTAFRLFVGLVAIVFLATVDAGRIVAEDRSVAADRPVVRGDLGKRLDEYLSRLERFGFAGGAVAVRGRDVLLLKSYGLADRANGIRLATDSVYSIGSITKQFTAAAILTLEMRGRLVVTDLISKYLDGVPPDKQGVTIHHLLTHSSGLESDFSPTDYEPVGREAYVRRALQSTLRFKPGEGFEYSNAGYSLLAAIIERVSGQPYEAYLVANVLKPSGMLESGYKAPGWAKSRVAHGYRDGDDWGTILDRIQAPDAPYWMLRGNGGLHTTLADMVAWHRALSTNAVLSAEARAKYFKPYVAEGPAGLSHYAYGWAVSKTPRGTTLVQHNGGNGIFVAEFLRFVDEDTMLFLTSTDAGMKATPVVEPLERILFGGQVTLPPSVIGITPERLASLAGRWTLPGGGVMTLRVDGPSLTVRPEDPAVFAALSAPAKEDAERYARLARRTGEIAAKAFAGDVADLHAAMGGEMPIEGLKKQEAAMMKDRESRLGRFLRSSVLGTAPREEDTVQTIVRLEFEKGAVYNAYIWGPRRILGIRGFPELPPLRFLPTSDREFVAFSLEGGGTERTLSFDERDGKTVLTLATLAGPITAQRGK
jgi:CubicO group peptidase (beta-lactamase class C family)